jgi:signal transduction histidine kinase
MGMGLSICRSIIQNHDGRLSLSAGQPYGSIFYVFLPIGPPVRNNETAK